MPTAWHFWSQKCPKTRRDSDVPHRQLRWRCTPLKRPLRGAVTPAIIIFNIFKDGTEAVRYKLSSYLWRRTRSRTTCFRSITLMYCEKERNA